MHPRLLSWTAFLDCSPGLLSWTPIFEIIGFWTGPGADIDVLRVWIICDGFSVFYVFPNVMIWVFGGVGNHQREKDGS